MVHHRRDLSVPRHLILVAMAFALFVSTISSPIEARSIILVSCPQRQPTPSPSLTPSPRRTNSEPPEHALMPARRLSSHPRPSSRLPLQPMGLLPALLHRERSGPELPLHGGPNHRLHDSRVPAASGEPDVRERAHHRDERVSPVLHVHACPLDGGRYSCACGLRDRSLRTMWFLAPARLRQAEGWLRRAVSLKTDQSGRWGRKPAGSRWLRRYETGCASMRENEKRGGIEVYLPINLRLHQTNSISKTDLAIVPSISSRVWSYFTNS
jgi:hypothetical protein